MSTSGTTGGSLTFPRDINILTGVWDGAISNALNDTWGGRRSLEITSLRQGGDGWYATALYGGDGRGRQFSHPVELDIALKQGVPFVTFLTGAYTTINLALKGVDQLTGTFNLQAGGSSYILFTRRMPLAARLDLRTPVGAAVKVDREIEIAPTSGTNPCTPKILAADRPICRVEYPASHDGLTRLFLSAGDYKIVVTKAGFSDWTETLSIAPGAGRLDRTATLSARDLSPETTSTAAQPSPPEAAPGQNILPSPPVFEIIEPRTGDSVRQDKAPKIVAVPPPSPVPPPPADVDAPVIVLNYPPDAARLNQEQILIVGLVTDNVAVEEVLVSVNGKMVDMTAQSAVSPRSRPLRTQLTLQPGENVIEITAVDKAGNASQLVRSVTRVAPRTATSATTALPQSDHWAVVVGIGNYEHAGIPRLKYAVRDADAVYQTLIGAAGFKPSNVLLLTDFTERKPTLKNIKYALGTFLARAAKKDDTVLIFFAGHGAPEADPRGLERDGLAKYLIPSDADPDDLFSTALPMDDLQAIFGRIESERIVAFLDACYSGAAGGRTFSPRRTRGTAVDDLFLERLTRSKGRAIVTASRPSEVSIELPDLNHGIFTYYLVEGLRGAADLNRDGIVTLQELYEYLEQEVTNKSRAVGSTQHPVMKGELEGVLPLTKVRRQ